MKKLLIETDWILDVRSVLEMQESTLRLGTAQEHTKTWDLVRHRVSQCSDVVQALVSRHILHEEGVEAPAPLGDTGRLEKWAWHQREEYKAKILEV
eukprot:3657345-Rhodomonas_salina.1